MENQAKKDFLVNLSFVTAMGFLFYISARFLLSYLLPFVIASLVAWAVQRAAKRISQNVKLKTGTVASLLAALLYILAAAVLFFTIYRISVLLSKVLEDLPSFLDYVMNFISKAEKSISAVLSKISPKLSEQLNLLGTDMLEDIRTKLTDSFSAVAAAIAKKTPSFLFSSVVALVASCYIAKDFSGLTKFISSLCGKRIYNNILKVKNILCTSVLKIAKGYLALMLITFAELTVGFLIIGIKYAPLWAFLIAAIDLLPVLGTGIALIPWGVAELVSGNTVTGILVLVIYLVVTVVRNFLEPKIIGGQIGINPLFTLLAMFVGVKFFGFAGLFVLPITLIVIIKYYKAEMDEEKILT